jgi:hypothetical protein
LLSHVSGVDRFIASASPCKRARQSQRASAISCAVTVGAIVADDLPLRVIGPAPTKPAAI